MDDWGGAFPRYAQCISYRSIRDLVEGMRVDLRAVVKMPSFYAPKVTRFTDFRPTAPLGL